MHTAAAAGRNGRGACRGDRRKANHSAEGSTLAVHRCHQTMDTVVVAAAAVAGKVGTGRAVRQTLDAEDTWAVVLAATLGILAAADESGKIDHGGAEILQQRIPG